MFYYYFVHLILTEQPNEHFYLILSDAIYYLPVISYQFHYHLSYVQPYVSLKSQKMKFSIFSKGGGAGRNPSNGTSEQSFLFPPLGFNLCIINQRKCINLGVPSCMCVFDKSLYPETLHSSSGICK